MKTTLETVLIFICLIFTASMLQAEEQTRKLDSFSEISLRISATVHIEQGSVQNLEIVAKPSTLDEIITEVKDKSLIIRYPNKNYISRDFQPGKIEIFITIPEINSLAVSGSGDITADDEISSKIIDLSLSGSGNIKLPELSAERVKAVISGSGNIEVGSNKLAEDLSVTISGSGNFKGLDFSSEDVSIKISGSGNASVEATKNLYIRMAGSGNVNYKGNPMIDQSTAGSGKVRKVD